MSVVSESMGTEVRAATPMDEFEASLAHLPAAECPLVHLFTPGLYVRRILIPAGTLLTSMRHKTRHPFVIVSGKIDVVSEFERVTYEAPFMGVTEAGTKRALYAHEDTMWVTFHANPADLDDPDEMGEFLIEPNDNPLSAGVSGRFDGWRNGTSPSVTHRLAGKGKDCEQ